jgi:predicted metalloprotease with PDZ domain
MKDLYHDFALNKKGYSESDFKNTCIKYGGEKILKIFKKHIYGIEDYIPSLSSALEIVGLELKQKKNTNLSAQYFGFVTIKENGKEIIKKIEPDSIADKKGIGPEDEIVKLNNKLITGNLNKLLENCNHELELTFKNKFSEKTVRLSKGNYYKLLEIKKVNKGSENQILLRKKWIS